MGEAADDDGAWSAWLAAAQDGDAAAYRRFLMAILPWMRKRARHHLSSDEDAEDAVQNALVTLHRVRHTYDRHMPVKPWLAAIVSRRAIDLGRQRGRVARRETFDERVYETSAAPEANSGSDAADAARALGPLLSSLTPKQVEAIELTKLREMSLLEAAAVSGQTVGALKVNVHRAIQRMRGLAGEGR